MIEICFRAPAHFSAKFTVIPTKNFRNPDGHSNRRQAREMTGKEKPSPLPGRVELKRF